MTDSIETFDTIIVGGGSAGCVLASRLSGNPRHTVLLLEAGPGTGHPLVDMPRGWVKLTSHPRHAWAFPVEHEQGRPAIETWARGRGLGGSSAINGMVFCRGAPQDYDSWAGFCINGWNADVMARAFSAFEDRGDGHGLLQITRHPLDTGLGEAILSAGESLGLPRRETLVDAGEDSVGVYAHSVDRRGRRASAVRAFIDPVRHRRNLEIRSQSRVERILIEDGRAAGVVVRSHGMSRTIRARFEVIVSCGAIQSPQLLQLSGIGPAAHLREVGIPVLRDLPGVGRNLAEHLVVALPHRLKGTPGHNASLGGLSLVREVLRYYLTRKGVLGYGASEMGAFVRSRPDVPWPDLQLSLSPYTFARGLLSGRLALEPEPGITIIGYALRPESRGSVSLRSADIGDTPRIVANWLATEGDRATARAMMRAMRQFMARSSMLPYVGHEIWPGASVISDEDMLAAFRSGFVSGLHAVGTCRMGNDDNAVLDDRLRVRGIDALRVVDASAIPAPISSNTNGPVMALAWRAVDLILEDRR